MKYPNNIKILGVAALSSLFLLILKLPKVIKSMQTGFISRGEDKSYPDYPVESLGDILRFIYPRTDEIYLFSAILLVLVLTPFAFYKEHKYGQGQVLSFLKKWLILSVPFCSIFLIFFGAHLHGAILPELFYVLILLPSGFALYLNILLYFIVDLWVEKPFKYKA